MSTVNNAFPYFPDAGTNGYIYIGAANQDAQTNPITVYRDAALTLPWSQPIRTLNGYPAYQGAKSGIYTNASTVSLTVLDDKGRVVTNTVGAAANVSAADLAETGAPLIGFTQYGVGAVARTVQAKLEEVVSILDFGADPTGVADSLAALQAAIDRIKALGGGTLVIPSGNYLITSTVKIWGTFGYRGILIAGQNAQITSTHAGPAFHFRPDPRPDATDPAPQLKQRAEMSGLTFIGPGRTVVGAYGIYISDGATVDLRYCKARGYERGLCGVGSLINRWTELELSENNYGVYLTSTGTFAPNDIHFNSCKIFENIRAVYAEKFPNGTITFNECEMEGNNTAGNDADGIAVFDFDNAGIVNIIGSHLEANYGQWHVRFSGGAGQAALNVIGAQLIPGNNNTSDIEMSNKYGSYGHLQVIGARVSSGLPTQIAMTTGTSACIIGDPIANVTGDLSKVLLIRSGKMANGVNAVPANAGYRAKGSSGIALDIEGISRFVNAANTRLGYSQVTEAGQYALVSDQDGFGFQFNTVVGGVGGARFYINRTGSNGVEPGADNSHNLGSPALRWGTVYAGTGTINTSDERQKEWRGPLSEAELRAAARIADEIGIYQWADALAEKGVDARLHTGVRAQRVFALLEQEGLDWRKYAWCCYDAWPDQYAEALDGEHEERVLIREAGDQYGIRTDQLCMWLIAAQAKVQSLLAERLLLR